MAKVIVLAFEPHVNHLITHFSLSMGIVVWPLALIWIIGITNSINLIDGLDGLAGGTSILAGISILILSIWAGWKAQFAIVTIGLMIPAILSFLWYNWSPAKVFLGDNGSLPIGFLLATMAFVCRPESKTWIMVTSVVLMLGYPLLDMGWCVIRRARGRLPLFKGDRIHLHFRVRRLGLSDSNTAMLLLSISFYLQICALTVNLMSPAAATLGITIVAFSIFSLLFLIVSIEKWKIKRMSKRINKSLSISDNDVLMRSRDVTIMKINLVPLMEVRELGESAYYRRILLALELLIRSSTRDSDLIEISPTKITVVFLDLDYNQENHQAVRKRFSKKIDAFLHLYELQTSLLGLPLEIDKRTLMTQSSNFLKRKSTQKASAA